MRKVFTGIVLLILLAASMAAAETNPLTEAELEAFADQVKSMMQEAHVLNDPSSEEAASEDGFAYQYDFGVAYADRDSWTEDIGISAFLVMDSEIAGPRGISIDWEVNQVMAAVPCDNGEMHGTYQEALLYLEGDPEGEFAYGLVERDGQRISAMEYGTVFAETGKRIALVLGISGDGVSSIRMETPGDKLSAEEIAERYETLQGLSQQYGYFRVPRSQNGADLEMFQEGDLDFSALSYRTAEPRMMGEEVEDMLIDNRDGTWLRRVDGDGFEAVFTCNRQGEEARLVSYAILSPDLEGPRGIAA